MGDGDPSMEMGNPVWEMETPAWEMETPACRWRPLHGESWHQEPGSDSFRRLGCESPALPGLSQSPPAIPSRNSLSFMSTALSTPAWALPSLLF